MITKIEREGSILDIYLDLNINDFKLSLNLECENMILIKVLSSTNKYFDFKFVDSTTLSGIEDLLLLCYSIIYSYTTECKEKLSTIYCYDDCCPICGSELNYSTKLCLSQHENLKCKNKCYEVMRPRKESSVDIISGYVSIHDKKN